MFVSMYYILYCSVVVIFDAFVVVGQCYCEMGHRGADCGISELANFTIACSRNCSGHGTFDTVNQLCVCDQGWTGQDCSMSTYREKLS